MMAKIQALSLCETLKLKVADMDCVPSSVEISQWTHTQRLHSNTNDYQVHCAYV
jgi:hypothetical protein